MEYFPAALEKLVEQFARLPGIGSKSAQRLAFFVLSLPEEEAKAFADAGHRAFKRIDDLYIPVIAAIHGYALGGGLELALCCDIRLCSETAKFGQPEVGLGITPGFGGTQRLPRVVGTSNAMTLTLTGKPVGAEDALRMRLVNRVYPDAELMDGAMEMAETIANNAPLAVHYCKVAMSRRVDRFLENDLDYEAQVFGECFETEDPPSLRSGPRRSSKENDER